MKTLISFLVGVGVFILCIWGDSHLVAYLASQFPPSAHEWMGVIKIGLWLLVLCFTFALSIWLSILAGAVVSGIFKISENKAKMKKFRKEFGMDAEKPKMSWQQKLEQMQKEAEERKKNKN